MAFDCLANLNWLVDGGGWWMVLKKYFLSIIRFSEGKKIWFCGKRLHGRMDQCTEIERLHFKPYAFLYLAFNRSNPFTVWVSLILFLLCVCVWILSYGKVYVLFSLLIRRHYISADPFYSMFLIPRTLPLNRHCCMQTRSAYKLCFTLLRAKHRKVHNQPYFVRLFFSVQREKP